MPSWTRSRGPSPGLNKEGFEFSSHRSIIDEIVGKGYGHTESGERLSRMHAQEVVELILKKAGKDVLKQIELAAAVKHGLTDVNPNKVTRTFLSCWPSWRVSSRG